MAINRKMPEDPKYPAYASDFMTGETSTDVTFQQGKWWTTTHWINWRRDLVRDIRLLMLARGVRNYLSRQPRNFK